MKTTVLQINKNTTLKNIHTQKCFGQLKKENIHTN